MLTELCPRPIFQGFISVAQQEERSVVVVVPGEPDRLDRLHPGPGDGTLSLSWSGKMRGNRKMISVLFNLRMFLLRVINFISCFKTCFSFNIFCSCLPVTLAVPPSSLSTSSHLPISGECFVTAQKLCCLKTTPSLLLSNFFLGCCCLGTRRILLSSRSRSCLQLALYLRT